MASGRNPPDHITDTILKICLYQHNLSHSTQQGYVGPTAQAIIHHFGFVLSCFVYIYQPFLYWIYLNNIKCIGTIFLFAVLKRREYLKFFHAEGKDPMFL